MEKKAPYISKTCSWNRKEETCIQAPCDGCPWSYAEIERRKKLPLEKFPNGLMGKYVGKNYAPIGESPEE